MSSKGSRESSSWTEGRNGEFLKCEKWTVPGGCVCVWLCVCMCECVVFWCVQMLLFTPGMNERCIKESHVFSSTICVCMLRERKRDSFTYQQSMAKILCNLDVQSARGVKCLRWVASGVSVSLSTCWCCSYTHTRAPYYHTHTTLTPYNSFLSTLTFALSP